MIMKKKKKTMGATVCYEKVFWTATVTDGLS